MQSCVCNQLCTYSNVQSKAFELLTNFWNNIVDMLSSEFATTARGTLSWVILVLG